MASDSQHNAKPVIGVKTFATRVGFHPQTVRDLANAGQIPGAYRVGKFGHWRFPVEAVTAFKHQNSPQRTQTSSSGASSHGECSGPDLQDGDVPAEMPAGSFDSNPGQPAQEASNGHR